MNRVQALASLSAYLPDDKEIIKILNMCNLNPVDGWRIWQNQYSPYLKVKNNKKLIVCKKTEDHSNMDDLYAYSDTKDVARISKKLLFIIRDRCFEFLFIGNDDLLRYRKYLDGIYLNHPPLSIPIEDIRTLIKQEVNNSYCKVELTKNTNSIGTNSIGTNSIGWVTSWPPKYSFYEEIKTYIQKEIKLCNNPVESLILDSCVM